MKELTSKKHPEKQPQLVSDEEYARLVALGLDRRYHVRDIVQIKNLIPTPKLIKPVIEEKKIKKSDK